MTEFDQAEHMLRRELEKDGIKLSPTAFHMARVFDTFNAMHIAARNDQNRIIEDLRAASKRQAEQIKELTTKLHLREQGTTQPLESFRKQI